MAGFDLSDDLEAVRRVPAVARILDVVCRTTGMGFAAVARVTEGHWVACSVLDQIGFGLQPGGELKVETTICHEIRQSGEAVVINDTATDKLYCDHSTPALYGFQSYISMPIIMADGSFFGTLCAIDPQPRLLDRPEIVGSFKLFADLIALHLDVHRKLVSSETTLLREREVAVLREQFIAVLGHDLRNPLASIAAGARAVVRHPDRAAEIASHMERSGARMAGLIDNVTDFARGRLGGGFILAKDTAAPIVPVLQQVVDELRSIHPDHAIETEFAIEEDVACDRTRMEQLLSNLLGNALTHGSADEPVRVHGFTRDGVFELSVANHGQPIAPAALGSIFQPFVRGTVRANQEGLGLGLYISSEIARAHGGTLDVVSTADETRFTLRMPACA